MILKQDTPNETTLRVVLESEEHGREYFDHYQSLDEMLEGIRRIVESSPSDGIERLIGIAVVPQQQYGDESPRGAKELRPPAAGDRVRPGSRLFNE